ncbi:GMC family oxidoreductase [Deinococcus sp.]|uniref:GMC family oxidoreductase n=1 Tax=Deinococcus sp. TaxID=47478 RepID=UPI0025BEEC04|nr:GMC family oxidoreductase N-terminal domain-containing protein [Deinococcus sp.]
MDQHNFDYIIAGGGTAGCVLANRLTVERDVRVLLLEAGPPDSNPMIHLPPGYGFLLGRYDWRFATTPQRHCYGRRIPLAQGRVIGGGGSVNAQVFTRGQPGDYDEWASEYGCVGWSFKDVQPYFLRSEGNARLGPPWHGQTGPLKVSDPATLNPLSAAWIEAAQQHGLPYSDDFNGATQYGVGPYQTTTYRGKRWSTASGYLRPALQRPNLTLRTGRRLTRLLLAGDQVYGVEVLNAGGQREQFFASREVLVTAGGLGSPRLLMLSGIGDPADLRAHGVVPKVDLPGVGQNLHDHYAVHVVCQVGQRLGIDQYRRLRRDTLRVGLDYLLRHSGPASSTGVEVGGFSYSGRRPTQPDLQHHFLPALDGQSAGSLVPPGYGCKFDTNFSRPRSRGRLSLISADPLDSLQVDPNYLADPLDLEMNVQALEQCLDIVSQPALARYGTRVLSEGHDLSLRSGRENYVRGLGRSASHLVGTCAMGAGQMAVVDPQLRVHGLRGLRICDSSVMPRLISSNTQAPTVMIAEKAADLVLGKVAPPD